MRRVCGECRQCCFTLGIEEINGPAGTFVKPPNETCPHECKAGCAIHAKETKPFTCRTFACSWLCGMGDPIYDRPDRAKVVVSSEENRIDPNAGAAICIYEVEPGICRSQPASRAGRILQESLQLLAARPTLEDGTTLGAVVVIPAPDKPRQLYTLAWANESTAQVVCDALPPPNDTPVPPFNVSSPEAAVREREYLEAFPEDD